jgi:hypothetical protein
MAKAWQIAGVALLLVSSGEAVSAPGAAAPAPKAPAPAAQPKTAAFKVGTVAFEMPIPEGYCIPAGAQMASVELLSKTDNENVTDLVLFPCIRPGQPAGAPGQEFLIVKTPKMMVDVDTTRAAMLPALGAAFETSAFKEGMAAGRADAAKAMEEKTGEKIEMVGEVGPRGRDETCGYIGGAPQVKGPQGTIRLAMGACLTVVGSRFVTVLVCTRDEAGTQVQAMMARARRFAETIRRTS